MGQEAQAGGGFPSQQLLGQSSFSTLIQADRIADQALSMALEFTGASQGYLILLDAEGRNRYCFGRDGSGETVERRPTEDVLEVISAVRESRRPLTRSGAKGERASVCVPLSTGQEFVGVLYLERGDDDGSFEAREERLAELAAGQLAISLTARFLYEQMIEKRKQVELIDRASRMVTSTCELPEVLEEIVRTAQEALGAQAAGLALKDEHGEVKTRIHRSLPADLLAGETCSGRLVRSVVADGTARMFPGSPSTGERRDSDPCAAVAVPVKQVLRERRVFNERRRSGYGVPFTKVLGAIYLENRTRLREFSDDDQLVLKVFADHITNAVASDALYRQASTDTLTGLASRRYLDLRLSDELEFAASNKLPLSIVMLDIDNFKEFNDARGHHAGDEVLREVGRILNNAVRSYDICGRYGGEEFVLVLPETDTEGAQVVAENVRNRIASAHFLDAEEPATVTVSLGVAAFPSLATDLTSLMVAADTAMYRAKRGGKNRFAVAGGQA